MTDNSARTARKLDRSTCPLLAVGSEDTPLCRAEPDELVAIRPLYATTICRKARHFTCPRFVAANPAIKRAAVLGTLKTGDSSSQGKEVGTEPPPSEGTARQRSGRRSANFDRPQPAGLPPATGAASAESRESPGPTAATAATGTPPAPVPPGLESSVPPGRANGSDVKVTSLSENPTHVAPNPAPTIPAQTAGVDVRTRRRARPSIPARWLLVAAASVLGSGAAVELHRSVSVRPHVSAPRAPARSVTIRRPLAAPSRLVDRQLSARRTIFSWRSVPGATIYGVRVGKYRYLTRASHLVVDHPFRPGTRHSWDVRGRRGMKPGPVSSNAIFTVLPMPSRVWSFRIVRIPHAVWFLTLYNPGAVATRATISDPNGSSSAPMRVRIPARATAEVHVPIPEAKVFTIVVRGDAPLLGERLRIGVRAPHPVYGIPGA